LKKLYTNILLKYPSNTPVPIYCILNARVTRDFHGGFLKMSNLIKKLLINSDEQKVLDAIIQSGLKTMRVVGRGTLVVDAKEVTGTDKFRSYAEQAKKIVEQNN
jgi:hypothetical protein